MPPLIYPLRRAVRIVFLAALPFLGSRLHGQSTLLAPGHTMIADVAWTGSALTLFDVSRVRSAGHPPRLANLSVRAHAGTGAETLIAGAVVQGSGIMPTLVRAIGPGLGRFGVSGYVRRPFLEIFNGEMRAAETNVVNPGIAAMSAYVGAFALPDTSLGVAGGDAAIAGNAASGNLTAHCSAADNVPGIALLEFYDAASSPTAGGARFVNLSARARVGSDEGIMVVGFVVSGEGAIDLLLRGVGSTLSQMGVSNVLADPVIELFAGDVRIASNDNWRTGGPASVAALDEAQNAVQAFALASPNDAALRVTLPPGAYTLQVKGADGRGGIALAEIHEVGASEFNAARATNAVGIDVLCELVRGRPVENVIISPYSIESALALAYAGADGGNRAEMARVLRLPSENGALRAGFAVLRDALTRMADDSILRAEARSRFGAPTDPIKWSAANRLFGQKDYPFRAEFLALMRDGFQAPLETMDFGTAPEPSRLAINRWVEEQTRDKIKNLIPMNGVTSDTRLVLVNALYLNAPWETPFERSATAPRPFRSAAGGARDVPTMQHTGTLGYAKEGSMTVVSLDYLGRELQFLILFPDEGTTVDSVAGSLTPEQFERWAKLGATNPQRVALSLPKFRVEGATVPLGATLRDLGMRQAFDLPPGSANFDRIASREDGYHLAISDVYHQTFIAVDEMGTEAAAATAVVITTASSGVIALPPIQVRVDRPFLFAIQHRASGACLFLGKMMDVP